MRFFLIFKNWLLKFTAKKKINKPYSEPHILSLKTLLLEWLATYDQSLLKALLQPPQLVLWSLGEQESGKFWRVATFSSQDLPITDTGEERKLYTWGFVHHSSQIKGHSMSSPIKKSENNNCFWFKSFIPSKLAESLKISGVWGRSQKELL